jgi:hypothetical protein
MADAPATADCPDETTCLYCGLPIFWNDYGYVHYYGWVDCVPIGKTTAKPVEWLDKETQVS